MEERDTRREGTASPSKPEATRVVDEPGRSVGEPARSVVEPPRRVEGPVDSQKVEATPTLEVPETQIRARSPSLRRKLSWRGAAGPLKAVKRKVSLASIRSSSTMPSPFSPTTAPTSLPATRRMSLTAPRPSLSVSRLRKSNSSAPLRKVPDYAPRIEFSDFGFISEGPPTPPAPPAPSAPRKPQQAANVPRIELSLVDTALQIDMKKAEDQQSEELESRGW